MSQTNRSDAPLFQVRNHHSAACGTPPHIDDLHPNQYLGYFENQYGEQAVFVYGRNSKPGRPLPGRRWLGDPAFGSRWRRA